MQSFYASFGCVLDVTFYLYSTAYSSKRQVTIIICFSYESETFPPFGVEIVRTVYRAVIISIESNITFVPEVTMYNDRSSCWTRCSQSTTSTTQRAKVTAVATVVVVVVVVAAAAAAAAVVVAASGTETAEASGIAAAARNQALASRPTTRARP